MKLYVTRHPVNDATRIWPRPACSHTPGYDAGVRNSCVAQFTVCENGQHLFGLFLSKLATVPGVSVYDEGRKTFLVGSIDQLDA